MIYGYKLLKRPDDWRRIAGAKKWQPTCSAYELAHQWHAGKFPRSVQAVLKGSGFDELKSLSVACLFVEHPTFLDTFKAPSTTDIMVHCRTPDRKPVIIAVEGKALETFASRIRQKLAAPKGGYVPTALRRLEHLSQMVGIPFPPDSTLRYQLVHRTASAVSQAALHGAAAAMVLIHSFAEKPETNWLDYQAFLQHLGVEPTPKNTVSAPVLLGPGRDLPTYFSWVTDEPVGKRRPKKS